MALNAAQQWWVRPDGDVSNGGGYDSTVSGAGTNYCDQAAAQLSLVDLACLNNTTLTSVVGGFTSAMIGNIIRIASGTNFTPGYYMITARASTSSVTLDRNPTNGSNAVAGVGSVGGAFATIWGSFANGGTGGAAAVATPLAAGHKINVRGAGSNLPSSADYTTSSYYTFPAGDDTSGKIKVVGYNGRPRIDSNGLWHYNSAKWYFENYMQGYSGATNGDYGGVGADNLANGAMFFNCVVDQGGYDCGGFIKTQGVVNCYCFNSGSTSAGSYPAISGGAFSALIMGNVVLDWRHYGIYIDLNGAIVRDNIVAGCTVGGIYANQTFASIRWAIIGNSIYGNGGDGIYVSDEDALPHNHILNNIIVSNGGYGLNINGGSASANVGLTTGVIGYNAFYSNTSGARNNLSAAAGDVTLTGDPFTNAAGSDFTLNNTAGAGAACKATGFPSLFPG